MLSVKQGGIKYDFGVFGMTRPGIEPQPAGSLANKPIAELMWVLTFPKGISPRVNPIARLELELTCYDVAV